MFKKYPKIHRLGKDEVDDILFGQCYIQEKIDGANTSIWIAEDGFIRTGSRNRDITGKKFNGFNDYVHTHDGIKKLLEENPEFRLYGEWLVRHSIPYKETAYRRFYLFDIQVGEDFLTLDEVVRIGNEYEIDMPELFGIYTDPTKEELKELVGKSTIAEKGEGIVIKNFNFVNGFGDMCYAKMVVDTFAEANAITFGGNNKYSETYWEIYVINKYVTLARVQKIMHKIEPEIDGKFEMCHIPRIINTVYHDMLSEEIWEIQKKAPALNLKKLKSLTMKKAKQIFVDIINDDISVADE